MANRCNDLPVECWELIFNRLHHKSDWESFSLVNKQFLALTNRLRLGLTVIDSTLLIHGTISKLIHRFPNLNSIDLSNFTGELDPVLIDLANSVSYTSNLEQLDVSNHKKLPFKGLKELGRKLKGLRVLTCSNLTLLRDSDLYVIAELFPFLEELDISYPSTDYVLDSVYISSEASNLGVTDSGVEFLSVNLSSLRKINVAGNHLITDRSLVALSMNCLNLEGLEIDDCPFITLKGILSVLRTCAALSWISVSEMHIAQSNSGFECLATSSRTLQKLEVSNSIITDEFLFVVANASLPLYTLSLCWCTDFTLSGISKLLCAYQSIKFLSLVQVDFLTDECMNDLSQYLRYPSLEERFTWKILVLERKVYFHKDVKNPRIKTVNLASNMYLDDDCLINLALMCPNMEILDVSSSTCLTEAGITFALEVCNKIKYLHFDSCPGIKHIEEGATLSNLQVISAADSSLNDEGLAMIGSRCSHLVKLNLENCKGVTIEGLRAMVENYRSLMEINLKKCPQVSIDSLNSLVFLSSSLRRVALNPVAMLLPIA